MRKLDNAAKRLIAAFEAAADAEMDKLPLLQMPARAPLAFIHDFLFAMHTAPSLQGVASEGVAETTMSRLSYLLPFLVKLAADPYGVNAEDAISAVREVDPEGKQFMALLSYAHASQILPEAWRGYYSVSTTATGLSLKHVDDAFALAEASDILISELGLPFRFNDGSLRADPDVADLARDAPRINIGLMTLVARKKAIAFRHGMAEPKLVSDAALGEILGVDHERFAKIQAACFGLAETAYELAFFLTAWWQHEHNGANEMPIEALEWCSTNLNYDFAVGLIAAISGATDAEVARVIDAFSIDFRQVPAVAWGGDGFFPPFARFENALLFSPLLVQTFMSARNAIYGFAAQSRQTVDGQLARGEPVTDLFGSLVANDLEPVLVAQTVEVLPKGTTWIVRPGVDVPGGEIDLLIVDTDAALALCIQAKAPLPPQGARLTARLGERCEEGLGQIARFSALPISDQRSAIEAAIGIPVPNLEIRHGLLARACFGTSEAWNAWPAISLMTLATVTLASKAAEAENDLNLANFVDRLIKVIETYLESCNFSWDAGQITVATQTLDLPLLKYDHKVVAKAREQAWPHGAPVALNLPDVLDLLKGERQSPT